MMEQLNSDLLRPILFGEDEPASTAQCSEPARLACSATQRAFDALLVDVRLRTSMLEKLRDPDGFLARLESCRRVRMRQEDAEGHGDLVRAWLYDAAGLRLPPRATSLALLNLTGSLCLASAAPTLRRLEELRIGPYHEDVEGQEEEVRARQKEEDWWPMEAGRCSHVALTAVGLPPGSLPGLRSLDLAVHSIAGLGELLDACPNLRSLRLRIGTLAAEGARCFRLPPALHDLHLSAWGCEALDSDWLEACTNLRSLHLLDTNVGSLARLSCGSLRRLVLDRVLLQPGQVGALGRATQLEDLALIDMPLDVLPELMEVVHKDRLRRVVVSDFLGGARGGRIVPLPTADALVGGCSGLEELVVQRLGSVECLRRSAPSLRTLHVGCLAAHHVPPMDFAFPALRRVYAPCHLVCLLPPECPALESVSMSTGAYMGHDQVEAEIAEVACATLQAWAGSLRSLQVVSPPSLDALALDLELSGLRNLTRVEVFGAALRCLALEACPRLEHVAVVMRQPELLGHVRLALRREQRVLVSLEAYARHELNVPGVSVVTLSRMVDLPPVDCSR